MDIAIRGKGPDIADALRGHSKRGCWQPSPTVSPRHVMRPTRFPAKRSVSLSTSRPEEAWPAIIVDIPTCIATATVGEAVMRMDLADPPAMMLRYRNHGGLIPVYRRNEGSIGWIEPAYANEA